MFLPIFLDGLKSGFYEDCRNGITFISFFLRFCSLLIHFDTLELSNEDGIYSPTYKEYILLHASMMPSCISLSNLYDVNFRSQFQFLKLKTHQCSC